MSIAINWATKVIYVPQSYLTPVSGSLYELDGDQFRLDLKNLEDSEEGMVFPQTHNHNTQVLLSGVTYARSVEIINGYTITFENTGSPYTVRVTGANHNFSDVTNYDGGMSMIIGNSAGLVVVDSGAGDWSPTEKQQIRHRLGIDGSSSAPSTVPSLGVKFLKNQAYNNFAFEMFDATTHLPAAGLTVTAQRSIDGGSFAACTNAVSEISNGWYKINLSASDVNGDAIILRFTATGADETSLFIATQSS